MEARRHPAIQTDSAGRDLPAPVPPQACPVEDWLAFLGHRWNALVLWHLRDAPLRHGELAARLPGITPKVLSHRLAALRGRGLLERQRSDESAQRYGLTPQALALLNLLDGLEAWARGVPPPQGSPGLRW